MAMSDMECWSNIQKHGSTILYNGHVVQIVQFLINFKVVDIAANWCPVKESHSKLPSAKRTTLVVDAHSLLSMRHSGSD